jgi:hypothetical protein
MRDVKHPQARAGGPSEEITKQARRLTGRAAEPGVKQAEINRAIDDLMRFRETTRKAPLAEVLGARHQNPK